MRPKPGQTPFSVQVCTNDVTSPNPTTQGRDVAVAHVHINCGCVVSACGSVRCKTCRHISQGNTFNKNVTRRSYKVMTSNTSMTCTSENVVYFIMCNICGLQYVGETSLKLINRLNNHRNSLKTLPNLYLYYHFCSDRHTVDDTSIIPIEEVEHSDKANVTSLRLER